MKTFSVSPANILLEKKLYDFRVPKEVLEASGVSAEFGDYIASTENALSKIEGKADQVFRKIISNDPLADLDADDHGAIVLFTLVQMFRVPSMRSRMIEPVNQIREISFEMVRNKGGDLANVKGIPEEPTNEWYAKTFARMIHDLGPDLVKGLLHKHWILLKPHKQSKGGFYLTDNPVFITNDKFSHEQGFQAARNYGLKSLGVQHFLPLSKDFLLGFFCPSYIMEIEEKQVKAESHLAAKKLSPAYVRGSTYANQIDELEEDLKKTRQKLEEQISGNPYKCSEELMISLNTSATQQSERYVLSSEPDFEHAKLVINHRKK